ncbi:MAG: hypothetical protein O3A46_16720 [Candidatus Poribacteria bacterium]|nr:hypothetical protein [Candidatus Poribacteria bacterium]
MTGKWLKGSWIAGLVAGLLVIGWFGCGEDADPGEYSLPDGLSVQDFPIANGAVWAYSNAANPAEQYRITVEGTRSVSGEHTWKFVHTQLDESGTPLLGQAPPPSDYYSANGLHVRLSALTAAPGIFSRAAFVNAPTVFKAAAVGPNPVANTYVFKSIGDNLKRLEDDDPVRYDELEADTDGVWIEIASEALLTDESLNFQKHLPLRRVWEFPLQTGRRWIVFRSQELPRVPRDPQPQILAERVVRGVENVDTPGYSGAAFLVEEWVVGLKKDEDGNTVIPSLEDEDGDSVPQRGAATGRYWVAKGVGVVKYEYEFVNLGPPAAFERKTFELTRYTIPTRTLADVKSDSE